MKFEVTYKPPVVPEIDTVTITLTKVEAEQLQSVLGNINGFGDRKFLGELWQKLFEATGALYPNFDRYIVGTLEVKSHVQK